MTRRIETTVCFSVPDSDEFSGLLIDLGNWLRNKGATIEYRDIVVYQ